MFATLVASNGRSRRRVMTPATLVVSSIFHGALLAGAVYASVRPVEEPGKPVDLVTFLDVAEPEAPPPPPAEAAATPPIGAPAFVPPLDPPPFIPPPDPSQPRVLIELYTGDIPTVDAPVTRQPGTADAPPAEPQEGYTYKVDVLDSAPAIANRGAIEGIMAAEYPRALANAGINGDVVAEFVVLPTGSIDMSTVKITSASHERFEEATRKVLARFRFTPGRFRGQPVRVLTSLPIQWRVGR